MIILQIFGVFVLLLLLCLAAAILRTLSMKSKISTYRPQRGSGREQLYAEKLSRMIQCRTVSVPNQNDLAEFDKLHKLFEEIFPNLHRYCEKIDLDGNLLYKWKGSSSEHPILLMSHQDVVEANGEWKHAPFSGDIAEDRVWGRGSCDTKCSLMALLQAAEELIAEGFVPACDVYLSSSRTEEIGGDGAPKIVRYLKEQGVRLAMVCDEGGALTADPLPGVKGYFAMVGVFEKGNCHVKYTARSAGGHASAPPKNTPLARLAAFVNEIEKKRPFQIKFTKEVRQMFLRLAPYCSFPLKLVFGNLWLFEPLLKKLLPSISPQAAAMLQSTMVFTMAKASESFNVIPAIASVEGNLRSIPHQNTEQSLLLLADIAKRYQIEQSVIQRSDPSPVLDLSGRAFQVTEQAIAEIFKGSDCIPYVVTGATDARFYHEISDACVRFSPVLYDPQQLKSMHGLNENVYTYALPPAVDYYKYIVKAQQ